MIRITYLQHDGRAHPVEAEPGKTLMSTAIAHGIPGIDADCGGECICATCHILVEPPWSGRLTAPAEAEQWTLEMAVDPQAGLSRLACQIRLDDTMDGLVVRLPPSQR